MKTPLSVIIITLNEEQNIGDCLKSVEWADECIVVDSNSTDRTVDIAAKFTPNVFIHQGLGFAEAKKVAISHTHHQWILWLDADERVTEDLRQEIQILIQNTASAFAAYEIPRKAFFLGRWIKHSGWYPGYVIRLFDKRRAAFNSAAVHEGLDVDGPVARLRCDLLHYTDPNIFHYLTKFNRYTTLASEELAGHGKKFRLSDLLIRPCWLFCKMYVLRKGFLDGIQGFILAVLSSAYVFVKYAKLWEQQTAHHRAMQA